MPTWIMPMSRVHQGRCSIISTHAQCPPGSRRCPGSIMALSNYFYACAMPTWITPMSRVYHGRCAIISTHAHCLPGSRRCPGPSWERGFSPLPSFSTAISEHRTGSTEKEEEKNLCQKIHSGKTLIEPWFMLNISHLCVSFSRYWKVFIVEHELCWQKLLKIHSKHYKNG